MSARAQQVAAAEIGSNVSDNQHIDLAAIRRFFAEENPTTVYVNHKSAEYNLVREQVLELLDLVDNSGFLREVESVRDQRDAEDVLPSRY